MGIDAGLWIMACQKKPDILMVSTRGCCCSRNVKNAGSRKLPSIALLRTKLGSVALAFEIARRGAALLVVGDETSTQFPKALNEFRHRQGVGMKVNLLVNYGWEWDLAGLKNGGLRSGEISRLDLIVRWGGRRRLSGFLPVQSVYADFYVRDEYWPDFDLQHLEHSLAWFKKQDPTLGG